MKKMFPDYAESIIDDGNAKSIFDVLGAKYGDGYKNVTIMVGQDRLAEFKVWHRSIMVLNFIVLITLS